MFLLMRKISPYNSSDVLLGVFTTFGDTEAAKAYYFRIRESDPSDPWKEQTYKADGLVIQDLEIKQLPGEFSDGMVVFVVCDHSEGFGQVVRALDSIHPTAEAAEVRKEELDDIEEEGFPFPHYAVIDPVIVGSLHSDLREDQPPDWYYTSNHALRLIGGARRLFGNVQPT
jgi:hypothetical protein